MTAGRADTKLACTHMLLGAHSCFTGWLSDAAIEQLEACMGSLPVTDSSAHTCRCDEKADIFSYGVVLWELITQQHPRRGCLRDFQVMAQ